METRNCPARKDCMYIEPTREHDIARLEIITLDENGYNCEILRRRNISPKFCTWLELLNKVDAIYKKLGC